MGVTGVLVIVALAASWGGRSSKAALLAAPSGAKTPWDSQEASLWHTVNERAAPRLLLHGEKKLRQIVRDLRSDHLLRGTQLRAVPAARQPHFGSGTVVEEPAAAGMRVFKGRMLCAEGETSCVHPCEAFYTITGEEPPEDCKCKCAENPLEFYKKGSVICTCPDSPVSPENDMYPYPPGEGPMAAMQAGQAESSAPQQLVATPTFSQAARGRTAMVSAVAARNGNARSLAGGSFMGVREHEMELERDIDRRLAAMGVEVKPLQQMQQPAQLPASMGYRNPMRPKAPQIMWVGAGPAFLPPDGDYPGGSTGIDADGYLAFETGHGSQPYHGMYAPMQDAGIANRAPSTSLRQIRRGRARVLNKPLGLPKVGPPRAPLYPPPRPPLSYTLRILSPRLPCTCAFEPPSALRLTGAGSAGAARVLSTSVSACVKTRVQWDANGHPVRA